jgi:glycosyltransferase involved in cell wall biosynthesis
MRFILYNINSLGGGYDYANEVFKAGEKSGYFASCKLVMPKNAVVSDSHNILKILLTDQSPYKSPLFRKLYFIYRSFINPLKFYRYLKREKSTVVIFNDFDQLSSFYWSYLFKKLKKHHYFGVILHDPERDDYFPIKSISGFTMQKVMSIMDVAFYHGFLPAKRYYKPQLRKVEIPHGIYAAGTTDTEFESYLLSQKNESPLIGILGNIRDEKNYELIIESLKFLPDVKLLIAGQRANSKVPIDVYQAKVKELGLQSRVIWVEKYLTENELASAIKVCDIVSLYYKASFTSQSGILNTVGPFRKKIIVSDIQSSLRQSVEKYNLGITVKPNDIQSFVQSVKFLLAKDEDSFDRSWEEYLNNHSWDKNVQILAETFKSLKSGL